MKAKLFTKDMVFIDVIDISQISFKRQRNKEYTISCKPVSDVDYNWEQVSFVYFLDDNEEKTKRIQYKPCGYLEGYNGDSLSIKSMESYLESISVIPENFEWWQNKLLKNVLPDLCYGFRRIKKASLSEMQDVATSYHVKFDVLENGNGEVYADTGYYFSPSNTHELYYYSDGYVIYRMTLPAEARRQGLVLRWSDQTGTTTDVSVQFRWSNVSSDFIGTYSAEQSPLRGEGSRKNETVGVDIPESDNTYLFIKFNLKYDTGSTSVFPKGYNYEQEITTVQGEGEENYVYYGKTAILNAFEVIYRVDTRIEEGTISVSDTQLMQADLSNCSSLLSALKAISEAYNLTFFVSFEENIPLLNVYNEYINDTTNQTIITDKINSTVTRKEIKTETLQAVEAFGIGNGFDRIHAFVKADDLETNIKNIGKYEGEETSVEELINSAKAYIEKENEELSSASFEYYNMPLQVNDKVRAVINKNVYTSLITEENYSFDGYKTKKEYTIGIRKYAFSGFFTSPFSGLFLYKPETPTNLIATRMEQGWAVSWQGKTSRYILQYRRSSVSPWNTLSITGTSCTIPFTEYDLDYTFAIYAVDDRGQHSDAMYVYSNSSSETIYVWETYHDGDTQPDTPTGSGNTGGWHRDLTQNAKWVSKKEAHRITDGSWSVPVLTSNGVRLGVLNDTPDDVTGLTAYATKDGIQIQCNPMGVGAKNVVQSFEFGLLLEGASDWIWLSSFTNSAFYAFDRSVDGYPEADAIDGSQVRCKVKNTYNYISINYATATVNTDSYGTWAITAPVLSSYTSRRDFTVSAEQGSLSRVQYSDVVYRVEIKRYDDTEYFKPNLIADPYASEDNYKDGAGYVTVTNYIQQRVPLETQATDPQSTSYTYRFTTVNATTGVVGDSTTVTLIASASTAQDIVNHSMDAEKFNVKDLAAVSSVFGSIRSDGIAKDSTNFWNLSDPASALGYGEEGEMCVGTSASVEPYDPVTKPSGYKDNDSFFHFIPQTVGGVLKGLYMKLANFIITAINSTVTGTFIVLSRFTGKQLLRVSEEENKVYGLQRQTTYEDIENVTRVSGIEEYDTLDITEGGGVIYGVTGADEKLLAYNTATDTEVAIDCEAGDNFSVCQLVGDEVVCVGGYTIKGYNLTDSAWVKYTSITYAPTTISTTNKFRLTSQIYNGKLYCPSDTSTTMDIIDLSDNSYTSVTISATDKSRRTSQIYNGKLYCPNYGSTTMDIIDLSDNSYTSVTISATNKYRWTSHIYNGKLYCPNYDSTTMDIIDLSDNSYISVTISTTDKLRRTSQIYNGKLYCPSDTSTTMDIIDLSDNSYTSVTISTTDKQRWTSQIYNGKLYCPNDNSTTMDIIDLSDNSYTSVTISTTNKLIHTSQIYKGNLYCPIEYSTTMDIIDLSDNSYTSVSISSANRLRRTSQIYNGKLYCPSDTSTTMDIIQLPLTCADTHKTTKTYNNAHMYIVSANMVEKVDVLNETNTQLTLTSMPTPLASCSNSTDVYVVDLASGRIAKIDVTNAVTYTATTAKTGYFNYYCSGTTMYFTGRGAKVLKLNVTTGTQTEINLTTVLDNDLTYKVFYLSNYIYIFSQTSAVYFARVPTANFQLSAVEQYFLYNDIGNIRSRFWMGATTVYLAESRSGYMNKFTGVLLDQQVTRDVQKEIGSGFVERDVDANGVTTLATADGDKIIFDAEKNLVASRATKLETPRKINNVLFDGTADIITQEAPPTPWAQYSGKDIPMLPDNLSGTAQKVTEFTSIPSGWNVNSGTPVSSFDDNEWQVVCNSASEGYLRSIPAGSIVIMYIKCISGSTTMYASSIGIVKTYSASDKWNLFIYYAPTARNLIHYSNSGTYRIKSIYIGTGAYDRLVFDNSYHYRHLLNNAVVPTPQGLYFNGETSYLRSKEKITLPDVFTFSATVNCAVKAGTQLLFAQGTSAILSVPYCLIYRRTNTDTLIVYGTDGTVFVEAFLGTNYFTGLDNTDIKTEVTIDFINKTIKVYRNNVQFGTTTSAPTMLKPVTDYIYFGDYVTGIGKLLGYMRNIQLYDTALTDTQRNWLAQGNTPPILYDVTNYETEGYVSIQDADGTNTGGETDVDSNGNRILKLPATIKATLSGNADTADKWKTARNIRISDADGTNTGTAVVVDGSENETLKLPATIKANVTGNADTATNLATAISPNDSRVKTALNASGDAPIYACRAWVNFNGTGTVAIRASGNVSSITDNGVGDYTVNFTTAMLDANYSICGMVRQDNNSTSVGTVCIKYSTIPTTSHFNISTGTDSGYVSDMTYITVAIFR